MRDLLRQRAGVLVVASWLLAFCFWRAYIVQSERLELWIYCYPFSDLADTWRHQAAVIPWAKAINLAAPMVAAVFFPRHRFQAGRAAAVAILVALALWLGIGVWIASHAYPS